MADYYWDPRKGKAQLLHGTQASEARLKSLDSAPRVLHLATHGFFREKRSGQTERPLTLSGLALAGANQGLAGHHGPDNQDGIRYALVVQDLNLDGTELVTLSACDTGKGEVDYSEGVYGLVRSFQIAGSRNVLMTLWPLSDRLAGDFMTEFYKRWLDPREYPHPAEALRATRLAWIKSADPKKRDPKYWAPFVLVERR